MLRQEKLGPVGEVGFKQAMQRKWISLDKQGLVTRQVRPVCAKKALPDMTVRTWLHLILLQTAGILPYPEREGHISFLFKASNLWL